MKNKAQMASQRDQTNIPDWLYQEAQEDDFLLGKTPSAILDIDEDEE